MNNVKGAQLEWNPIQDVLHVKYGLMAHLSKIVIVAVKVFLKKRKSHHLHLVCLVIQCNVHHFTKLNRNARSHPSLYVQMNVSKDI